MFLQLRSFLFLCVFVYCVRSWSITWTIKKEKKNLNKNHPSFTKIDRFTLLFKYHVLFFFDELLKQKPNFLKKPNRRKGN